MIIFSMMTIAASFYMFRAMDIAKANSIDLTVTTAFPRGFYYVAVIIYVLKYILLIISGHIVLGDIILDLVQKIAGREDCALCYR